ncbi:rhombosortase [Roseateles violae]|uniref:Rhombosortase n=1 Tax=Roseateles violae TaxID=3058042 RepID=A0ABT8DLL1_9BURK|nr:rhombosortase [Pelomonas sp. PFR6]MDN3918788.1 rhombosortase [Pelomonas sp. PFR6]
MRTPLSSWTGISLTLAGLALAAFFFAPAAALDWQPALWPRQPWRALSAALVHWSGQHLAANLAGCAMLALLGRQARLGARCSLAWLLAWPATQLGLLALPEPAALRHFGGLSGVLHAGVAIAALELLLRRRGRERTIGALIGLGLALKLLLEQPLGPPLRTVPGWDIPLLPFAHLSGALAGALCALLLLGAARYHRRR